MKRLIMMAAAVAIGSLFADETYIESDGTQSINTGYYINAKTKIEIDFQMTEITSQGRLWGQNGTGCGNMAVVYFGDGANNFKIGYGNDAFSGAFLAVYLIKGEEVEGDPSTFTVENLPVGTAIILR